MKPRLRITFVLPFLTLTGGIRVVYEHTRQLLARGHDVRIVAPRIAFRVPWSAGGVEGFRSWALDRFVHRTSEVLDYYGLRSRVQRFDRWSEALVPDGDVVLATAWSTATRVAALPERCGRGVYFIQGHEAFFDPSLEHRVDATWRLPLERVVIASWLVRLARERFGFGVWGPVVNGVNLDQFHPRGRIEHEPPVVGMLYELQPFKGLADGFEALRLARRTEPGLRLHLFGRYRLRHALAHGDRFERSPSQDRIAEIYRGCDIFLSPSWTEGCQLPPMEAMASECAVIATEVGGIPDYSIPGRTVLTAPARVPEMLGTHLAELAGDPARRRALARAGREHISRFTWAAATDRLEDCLLRIESGEQAAAAG